MGKMSKCSLKSPCGKLVGVCTATTCCSQDRDHLLMQYGSLYECAIETREQMMGARLLDASDIVMLNRRVQWTEDGIRMSPDPRHVKDIIEGVGLEGTKLADTPTIVSQSGVCQDLQ